MGMHDLNISEDKLHECVHKMTSIDELKLGEWSCNRLGWKATNDVTGGLYRVTGDAWDKDKLVQWSFILKIVVPQLRRSRALQLLEAGSISLSIRNTQLPAKCDQSS